MRLHQILATLSAGGLALSGVLLVTPPPAVAKPPVVKLSGKLTDRVPELPPSGTPQSQQLASATVSLDPQTDRAKATIVLKAEPSSLENARLWLFAGTYDGDICNNIIDYSTPTHGTPDPNHGWSRTGATYVLDKSFDLYGGHQIPDSLNCAFALVTGLDDVNDHRDVLIGSLKTTYATTKLKVAGAKLLGSKQLKLLPREWITIDVTVRNVGAHDTSGVTVTGAGKGVKVKKGTTSSWIYSGSTVTVPVKVRLSKKRKATVKLTAKAVGTKKATKKVTIKPAKAPKRIQNGKYRTKNKRVTFRVKKGKITNLKVTAWALCGSGGKWDYYTMANIKVPRSGIVNVQEKRYTYIAKLAGRATGTRIKAKFSYIGGGCFANVSFAAKRVGK